MPSFLPYPATHSSACARGCSRHQLGNSKPVALSPPSCRALEHARQGSSAPRSDPSHHLPHRPLRPTDAIAPLSRPEHSREAPLTLLSTTEPHTALSFFCLNWKSTDKLHCPTPPPSRIHAIPSIILQLTSPTPSLSIHKLILSSSEPARAPPTPADEFFSASPTLARG